MSSVISKEDLGKLEYTFSDENVTRLGLLDGDWLIKLLGDKLTSPNLDSIIHLTECEIVKVHIKESWVTREMLSGP